MVIGERTQRKNCGDKTRFLRPINDLALLYFVTFVSFVAFVLRRSGPGFRHRSRRRVLAVSLLMSLTATASELDWQRIDFVSGERAGQPSVTVDPREGFVVTWQEREGDDSVLRFAVIDTAGAELRRGTIARGRDWFVNGADFPNLAVLDNGDWVTFTLRKSAPDTYAYDVHLQRSIDAGLSWGEPVRIHSDGTRTEHGFVSMVAAGADVVRLVWLDGRRMADGHNEHAASSDRSGHVDADHGDPAAEHMTLRSAALGRAGKPFDEHELDDLSCACCQTDAVRIGPDGMLVAYRDRDPTELRDIQLISYSEGDWSAPRLLHVDGWIIAGCPVNGPALAMAQGRMAALWPTMAGGTMALKFALGDVSGRFATARTLSDAAGELGRVDLAGWAEGWLYSRVSSHNGVLSLWLARLDAQGTSDAAIKLADKIGGFPRLAVHQGTGLVVWAEQGERSGSSRIGIARVW